LGEGLTDPRLLWKEVDVGDAGLRLVTLLHSCVVIVPVLTNTAPGGPAVLLTVITQRGQGCEGGGTGGTGGGERARERRPLSQPGKSTKAEVTSDR
jgi:hypothetical protein